MILNRGEFDIGFIGFDKIQKLVLDIDSVEKIMSSNKKQHYILKEKINVGLNFYELLTTTLLNTLLKYV